MKSLVHKLGLVGLALLIALPIAAQEKKDKKNGKKGGGSPAGQLKKQLEEAGLSADQQKKVDDAFAKHGSAIEAAAKKAGDAPRRIAEARKKLSADGQKGKALGEAARTEAKLTADETAAVDDLEKHMDELRSDIAAVLTPEQKEKTKIGLKGKKKNKQ